jgi:hypothetical protein
MNSRERDASDLDALQRHQDEAFGLVGPVITRLRDAERFLSRVGIALRYSATRGLPLASLYRAFGAVSGEKATLRPAIALTNRLLGEAHGIEVHVIAERVTLVHRSLMPALYALVRRGRPVSDLSGLSVGARTALSLLEEKKQVTAGDVRERLGARFDARHDPAYAALGELARELLVDRGPFEIPKAGIPYLSTEGYPYHLFHLVHAELAAAAQRYSVREASQEVVERYIRGAAFARVAKLASLFKGVLSPDEIEQALRAASRGGAATLCGSGRRRLVCWTKRAR